ncbi:MAG TPA: isoprenylcysteine carboxylmethyltransferase family protein [Devosiaceae bacterium]
MVESAAPGRPMRVLRAPPPLVFGMAFATGALLHRFVPFPAAPLPQFLHLAGLVVLFAGLCLAVWLAGTFLVRRTTLNPFADPSVFIASGAYRICRNPMYLSLVLISIGGAVVLGSAWPLLTLLAPLALLDRVVIPFEEARMLSVFGESYRAYSRRVRRWL